MKSTLFISFFLLLFSSFSLKHPIKMSFSKMEIKDNVAYMQTRLFLDDLTWYVQDKYRLKKATFDNLDDEGSKALQHLINKKVYLTQDFKRIKFTISKLDFSEDKSVLVLFLSSNKDISINQPITLRNEIMMDAFYKQVNMLTFNENRYKATFSHPDIVLNNE